MNWSRGNRWWGSWLASCCNASRKCTLENVLSRPVMSMSADSLAVSKPVSQTCLEKFQNLCRAFGVTDLSGCGGSFSSVYLTVARARRAVIWKQLLRILAWRNFVTLLLWHHRVGSTGSPEVSTQSRKGMICEWLNLTHINVAYTLRSAWVRTRGADEMPAGSRLVK